MSNRTFTAFAGTQLLESGDVDTVVTKAKKYLDDGGLDRLAIYDDENGYVIDFDFRGTIEEVLKRLQDHPMLTDLKEKEPEVKRGRGRPKLGVISKEVTLLPRHWEWLASQRGGASVTLRKLVEEARKKGDGNQLAEKAKDSLNRFMWDMASNFEGYEEVTRAFYKNDYSRILILIDKWPKDIMAYVTMKLMKIVEFEKLK